MVSLKKVLLHNRLKLVRMSFYANVVGSVWVYVHALFLALFHVVSRLFLFLGYEEEGMKGMNSDEFSSVNSTCETVSESEVCSDSMETEETEHGGLEDENLKVNDGEEEEDGNLKVNEEEEDNLKFDEHKDDEESTESFLIFKFPTLADLTRNSEDNGGFNLGNITSNCSEYLGSNTKESDSHYTASSFGSSDIISEEVLSNRKLIIEEKPEYVTDSTGKEEKRDEDVEVEKDLLGEKDNSVLQFHFPSESELVVSDSDSESNSVTSSQQFSIMSRLLDSNSDEFMSDGEFDTVLELDNIRGMRWISDMKSNSGYEREHGSDGSDVDEEILDELRQLEEEADKDLDEKESSNPEEEDKNGEERGINGEVDGNRDLSPVKNEDSNSKLEVLWEHQELIDQLKTELKNAKATGLPTIKEDSEFPKVMEDLKPWKIDDKFYHEERMGELHKIYKSYRERMRKFDILNYQKMYALGLFQSKDPLESISSSSKPASQSISSVLSQSFCLRKDHKRENDPTVKFMKELHSDLETVYVGQLCLSWEFLQWQYDKSLELWDSDQYGVRRYSQVAGEFQQLQVLMQRFLENEQFEAPRVQYYVKNRCFMRNLLQVPVIREDSLKDRKKGKTTRNSEYAITSDVLVEIIEESIRIFSRFIRADKDTRSEVHKNQMRVRPELQDPADLELLMEVQNMLHKKEKKIKELSTGGNCIIRRLRKHQVEEADQALCFLSQVDMKLVSRVLNMSRLTSDQLTWCQGKLNKIVFVDKKIHVEPSFLLFPCL